jgi:hypothetical protein
MKDGYLISEKKLQLRKGFVDDKAHDVILQQSVAESSQFWMRSQK